MLLRRRWYLRCDGDCAFVFSRLSSFRQSTLGRIAYTDHTGSLFDLSLKAMMPNLARLLRMLWRSWSAATSAERMDALSVAPQSTESTSANSALMSVCAHTCLKDCCDGIPLALPQSSLRGCCPSQQRLWQARTHAPSALSMAAKA